MVGQAPAREGDPSKQLTGRAGRRIADLAGISLKAYLRRTERINVLDHWPGRSGKGDAFPTRDAQQAAALKAHLLQGRTVIFMGMATAAAFCAFGIKDGVLLQWRRCEHLDCDYAVVPHPSGIVRWWNSEDNKRRAAEFLSSALGGGER